ncbi:hypothetical protein V1499_09940 [Neobacillus sp. SCS-31]|uniref:hypothetical protein n=1 Tax=Neobacillus oceani TaxID=3115292 RepID=UPI003906769B
MKKQGTGMVPKKAIQPLVDVIKRAQKETWEARKKGEITQEHKITSSLATNIRRECRDVFKRLNLNIEVLCHNVHDKGPGVEESISGADIGITLRVNKNENIEKVGKVKTVLIQSKLPKNTKMDILENEIAHMVGVSGAGMNGSFVAVYNNNQTKVSTILDIENANYNANIAKVGSLKIFFKKFFSCHYGKRGLDSTDLRFKPKFYLEFIVNK